MILAPAADTALPTDTLSVTARPAPERRKPSVLLIFAFLKIILIYIIKNEEWLARGVKNVNGLPRPVPYEIDLQKNEFIQTIKSILILT